MGDYPGDGRDQHTAVPLKKFTSMKSSKKMQAIQPQIAAINTLQRAFAERSEEGRSKRGNMALYKENG